jgi:hypothetical protein
VWITKLLWVEVMVGCNGKFNMVHCKVYNEDDGRKIYWFLNLTICKNMLIGENASSHTLDLLWANISCLLVFNMPRMNGCELVGIKVTLLKWWLFLMKKKHNFIQFVAIFWLLKLSNH